MPRTYGFEKLGTITSLAGKFREEDSPGNYLLRETNNQLQLVIF